MRHEETADWLDAALDDLGVPEAEEVPSKKPTTAAGELAAKLFEDVASGARPEVGAGMPAPWEMPGATRPVYVPGGPILVEMTRNVTKSVTPEQGLEAILKAVRESGDADEVMKAAGEWITKITQGITGVVKAMDDE